MTMLPSLPANDAQNELRDSDSEAQRQERRRRLNARAAYRKKRPDISEEELRERYSEIPEAPRKISRREIEARQQREGESNQDFQKRLRLAEQKRLLRARKRSELNETSSNGSIKRQKRMCPKPLIGDEGSVKAGPSEQPAFSPASPLIPLSVPESSTSEKGVQTDGFNKPARRTTDFGISAPGVFNDAPIIPWFRNRRLGDDSSPVALVTLPYVPQGQKNLLQDEAEHVEKLATRYPILEDTNGHIVFIRAPFPDDAQLIEMIVDHLAHNRGVKLEGFQKSNIVDSISTEYLAKRWNIQPARLVEVHDTFQKMKTPGAPYKRMLHSEFISGLTDPTRSEKVLDVPMSHRGAPPPFGLMDDGYASWNNTSSQYDWPHGLSREQWADMNWGLIHHAGTLTDEHHDADGKISLIAAEQGCKLWVAFFPKETFTRDEVHQYYDGVFNCTDNKDEPQHAADVCVGYTLVLLPGDCYFQPAGAAHAVYTPEPSFTRGSSFWSLATMHQVEVSRLYDVKGGIWSTNLDHDPDRVYEGLICMMLYLPTNPDKLYFKRSLAAFLLMILDPESYIPTHRRAYGFPMEDDLTEEEIALENHEKALVLARKSVKECMRAPLAKRYARRVAIFLGLPTVDDLKTFLGTRDALSDPGEKFSIAGVLNEILVEEEMERKAEEKRGC